MTCFHEHVALEYRCSRLAEPGEPVPTLMLDIKLTCSACGMPFRWMGLSKGVSFTSPSTSMDGLELREPVQPEPNLETEL